MRSSTDDAEPAKRRLHDVIAPPGGRSGYRTLRFGPKALAKWLAGSVRKDPADLIAAFDEAGARDPGHLRTWGRPGRRGRAPAGPDTGRGRPQRCRNSHHHRHCSRSRILWGSGWSLHKAGDPAAEDWGAVKVLAVLAGDSARAAAEITAAADAAGGARCGLDGAEAIHTLRAVISNGDFEEFWRFHLEREHQRLYFGIKQGQLALGA